MRLNKIYDQYKDQIAFLMIYIREAHPHDGWRIPPNLKEDIRVDEPTTDEARTEVASVCQLGLDLRMPMLIDSIDNDVEEKYISIPMRLYLIDRHGKIAYTGDRGPFGFNTESWVEAIKHQIALGN